jgi:hypothetical protein
VISVPKIDLWSRLPQLGARFTAGFNCAAIEVSPDGVLIKSPLTEGAREPCSFDVLVTSQGWAQIPHAAATPLAAPVKFICPHCSQGFLTAQARGGHVASKHKKEAA